MRSMSLIHVNSCLLNLIHASPAYLTAGNSQPLPVHHAGGGRAELATRGSGLLQWDALLGGCAMATKRFTVLFGLFWRQRVCVCRGKLVAGCHPATLLSAHPFGIRAATATLFAP
jgi:hypothetical protein